MGSNPTLSARTNRESSRKGAFFICGGGKEYAPCGAYAWDSKPRAYLRGALRIAKLFFTRVPRRQVRRRARTRARLPESSNWFSRVRQGGVYKGEPRLARGSPNRQDRFWFASPQLQIANKTPTQPNNTHAKIAPRSNRHASLNE